MRADPAQRTGHNDTSGSYQLKLDSRAALGGGVELIGIEARPKRQIRQSSLIWDVIYQGLLSATSTHTSDQEIAASMTGLKVQPR